MIIFAKLKSLLKGVLYIFLNFFKNYFDFSFHIFLNLIWIFSSISTMVSASVVIYLVFHAAFMPNETVKGPINLIFRECDAFPKPCRSDYPSATVNVHEDPNWNIYFARGQYYEFSLELHLPESPANHKVGMFIEYIALGGENGLIQDGKQSTMLRYKSEFLQTISTFVFSPFLLYGINEEKQVLKTKVIPNYQENMDNPISHIRVEIQSKQLDIYEAYLIVNAKFSGLRYFMFHYPLSSFFVGIISIMNFLISVTAVAFYRFYKYDKKKMLFSRLGNIEGKSDGPSTVCEDIDSSKRESIDGKDSEDVDKFSVCKKEEEEKHTDKRSKSSSIENLPDCVGSTADELKTSLSASLKYFLLQERNKVSSEVEGENLNYNKENINVVFKADCVEKLGDSLQLDQLDSSFEEPVIYNSSPNDSSFEVLQNYDAVTAMYYQSDDSIEVL